MTTIEAVYENGVFRPSRPLEIEEGQTVAISVELLEPPTTIEEWRKQMTESRCYGELMYLMQHCPEPDQQDGYDLLEALERNRGPRTSLEQLFELYYAKHNVPEQERHVKVLPWTEIIP